MYVMAINHDVADYDAWKSVFDSHPPSTSGAVFHRLNRGVDDPNNLTVVAGFPTLQQALNFRDDPVLKEKMGTAGVTSAPRFEIFEEVEAVQYA